jgi:hypothetical protein
MTEVDSAVSTIEEGAPIQITSQAPGTDLAESPYVSNHSGQASAIYCMFVCSDAKGLYAPWPPTAYSKGTPPELAQEFQGWDMLSDEALANFEQGLGE